MDVDAAQRDMTAAHAGGAPGVLVSGVAWFTAGLVGLRYGPQAAFAVLFFGGMLIVPGSLQIERVLLNAGRPAPGNPLERLGLESAAVLFAGILIAFVLLRTGSELAFPALAVAVGARYFAFRTIYGDVAYWALGAALVMVGMLSLLHLVRQPVTPVLIVGIIESASSVFLLLRWKRRN